MNYNSPGTLISCTLTFAKFPMYCISELLKVLNFRQGCISKRLVNCLFLTLSAWLSEDESPVVARANQRIAAITGLDMETAEELQVQFFKAFFRFSARTDFLNLQSKYLGT